jgi:hypothetical protein
MTKYLNLTVIANFAITFPCFRQLTNERSIEVCTYTD